MADALPFPDKWLPEPVRLVRDFVNSVEWQEDAESWQTPADLESWFGEHAGVRVDGLDERDVQMARRVREGLRSVLLMHAGHDPLPTAIDDLNDALATVSRRPRFEADGELGYTPASQSGLAEPLGRIVDAIEAARRDGSWERLKACSRDTCRWAYWDNSRNQSGRWCWMGGCGNYVKMRRRNADGPPPQDTIPHAGDRPPTLVDVAGRAGVSVSTVSNVVNDAPHVTPAMRLRVQSAIAELRYEPNLAARELRRGTP